MKQHLKLNEAFTEETIDLFLSEFEDDIEINGEGVVFSLINPVEKEIGDFFIEKRGYYKVKDLYNDLKLIFTSELFDCIFNSRLYVYSDNAHTRLIGRDPTFNWTNVTRIEIPRGTKTIGEEAFSGQSTLEEIILPEGITVIEEGAFSNCSSLKGIKLPDSLAVLGDRVFMGARSLKRILIPDKIDRIGWATFRGCRSLQNVALNNGVLRIEDSAFFGCASLKDLILPSKLQFIGESAFEGCASLTSFLIPDSVTEIEFPQFSGCNSLDKIICNNKEIAETIKDDVQGWDIQIICNGKNIHESLQLNESISETLIDDFVDRFSDKVEVDDQGQITLKDEFLPFGVDESDDINYSGCKDLVDFFLKEEHLSIRSLYEDVYPLFNPESFDEIFTGIIYKTDSNGRLIDINRNYNWSGVEVLHVPSNTYQIIDGFDHCSFREIILPSDFYRISPKAFHDCPNLTTIKCSGNKELIQQLKKDFSQLNIEVYGKELKEKINDILPDSTPFMLRDDGALLECGSLHPYILMSVKSALETNIKTLNDHINFLDWFYNNTLQKEVKELIDAYKKTNDPTLLEKLNTLTNNEFCRARTSNYKVPYGGNNGQIYFRISSDNGFNWFDLIYNVVLQYENLDYITIVKDAQAFKDVKDFDYYKIKGVEINQLPIEEFLTLQGNPIIESVSLTEYKKELKNQAAENEKLKTLLRDLAAKNSLELIDKNLTVHHIDDNIDKALKKYANNNPNNVLFINTSTIDANALHQLLHFCKNHYQKGLFSMVKTVKQIFDIPVYSIDSNNYIHQLSFKDAFKKVTAQLDESILAENQTKLVEQNSTVKSNGIYSVLNNAWVKEPVQADIPEINKEEFEKLFKEWEDRYFELLNNIKEVD